MGVQARRLTCSSCGRLTAHPLPQLTDAPPCCRAVLWTWAADSPWAVGPPVLEALTFGATHKQGGAAWKQGCFTEAPGWVRAVMAGGLRSPAGLLATAGLFGCPLWLWCRRALPGSLPAAAAWGVLVVPGRLLAGGVEAWVLSRHVRQLLLEDATAWQASRQRRS